MKETVQTEIWLSLVRAGDCFKEDWQVYSGIVSGWHSLLQILSGGRAWARKPFMKWRETMLFSACPKGYDVARGQPGSWAFSFLSPRHYKAFSWEFLCRRTCTREHTHKCTYTQTCTHTNHTLTSGLNISSAIVGCMTLDKFFPSRSLSFHKIGIVSTL